MLWFHNISREVIKTAEFIEYVSRILKHLQASVEPIIEVSGSSSNTLRMAIVA